MADKSSQLTILVKKSKGAPVRMTWDEFKVYKRNIEEEKSEVEKAMPRPAKTAAVHGADGPTRIAPSRGADKNSAVAKPVTKWTSDDHRSPLQEEVTGARKRDVVKTRLPDGRGDAVSKVLQELRFPVKDELRARLRSLVVSRMKDVRTDEQVLEYALRRAENGGLGLSEAQAKELLPVILKSIKGGFSNAVQGIQKTVPRQAQSPRTGKATGPAQSRGIGGLKDSAARRPQITDNQSEGQRPIIHDVMPLVDGQKTTKGPVDEIREFTLTDFRRLAPQAAKILRGKFENIKKESFPLYISAVQAWGESPLYQQYQRVIAEAISQRVKIWSLLDIDKNGLTAEEWKALAGLEY